MLYALVNSNMQYLLSEAVKLNPLAKGPTDLEVEDAIKYWLKRANGRLKKAQVSKIKYFTSFSTQQMPLRCNMCQIILIQTTF